MVKCKQQLVDAIAFGNTCHKFTVDLPHIANHKIAKKEKENDRQSYL